MRFVRAALVLLALAASPLHAQICTPFNDVPASDPFCSNIQWMFNRGVTLGCPAPVGQQWYCPAEFVRRDAMAAFMNRLADKVVFQQGGNVFGAPAVLGTGDHLPLDVVVGNFRAMRFEPNVVPNVIGGHFTNHVTTSSIGALAYGVAIGGGGDHTGANVVTDNFGTVAGGWNNRAGLGGAVGGGRSNTASYTFTTVSGGTQNSASGYASAVAGGENSHATGHYSFAAGRSANAYHPGCFVYGDASSGAATSCFANNEIVIRGVGGFYFWTAGNSDSNYSGARLAPGTGAWGAYSDRNGKVAIDPVDPADVLERVVAMPIATWQWKAEPGAIRHMGPTAQDFRHAFGLGDSDTQIVTVDADGVALAAIQGLNAKLEAEVVALRAELAQIRALLAERTSPRRPVEVQR